MAVLNAPMKRELGTERKPLKSLNRWHREWRTSRNVERKLDARVELVIALEKFTASVLGNKAGAA